jgi:opine dehydrogenase
MSADVVAVLGAGNGGCAAAADLTRRGFEVRLYNRSSERIAPIRERGGLDLTGVAGEGFVPLSVVTDDLRRAVEGASEIVITVPISGLGFYAQQLPPLLRDADQAIMLNPGHMGGGLFFAFEARRSTGVELQNLCETATLTYASRMQGPAAVGIFNVASNLLFSALPASNTKRLYERMRRLFPNLEQATNVLETGLQDLNAVEHPAQALCNAGWLEHTKGDYYFYYEGTTPAVASVIEAVDRERMALAEALGVRTRSFVESFAAFGYTSAEAGRSGSVYRAMQESEPNRYIKGPASLDHRYIHEDVGWGLVPWIHLADVVAVPVPTMRALTHIATTMNGIDYLAEGLTLERMGLAGVDPDALRSYVDGGTH